MDAVEKIARILYESGLLDLGDQDYGFEHLSDYERGRLDSAALCARRDMGGGTEHGGTIAHTLR